MEAESWDGMCEKIHQRASWPLTMSWTTDIDLFYETPLWNVTVTGCIDTCHLISRHLKNCALKALREVQSGSSEVESTDKCSYGSCKKVKKWSQCRGSRGLLSLSPRGFSVPLPFLPWGWCNLHIWGYWYFSRQSSFEFMLYPAWHFAWCTLHRS